ncbi:hypothetical protein KP509_07G017600 [Ceratopteris richardii]|uniref:Uncharacterized protein n=1 Tax=Ceratopteris richardii TaxID=49495 RepID=A0A8T2UIZ1_CERRI|nr:hypothetical protein KP509_07G017600 [Ceratopteris richardii]
MANLPTSFRVRLQEMEETRNDLLERLQAQKEIFEKKALQLAKQEKIIVRTRKCLLISQRKDAELSLKVFEKEEEMRATDELLKSVVEKKCSLQKELDNLERSRQQKVQYYEEQRSVMVSHQNRMWNDLSSLESEVQMLSSRFQELETSLSQLQEVNSKATSLDEDIRREELKQSDLLAQLESLEAQETKNAFVRMELEKKVEDARREADSQKQTLEKQKLKIMELQSENQCLENKLLETMQLRNAQKRFGIKNVARKGL